MTFDERPTPVLGIDYGRYGVLRVLGVGSFGTVYEAVQRPLGRHIALKVMHPHLVARADIAARFEQEARVAAAVRHANVVEVLDFGTRASVPYVAMELLEGESLLDTLTRERTLSVPVLVDLVMPVLAALSVMHARAVVHCDLKPANIFLSVDNRARIVPKVLDFGISCIRAGGGAAEGRRGRLGTPDDMSPEQVRGGAPLDARADLWALGVTLYEAATGRVPFAGHDVRSVFAAVLDGSFPAPRSLAPDLPERFEAVLLRALSRDPAERFARAIDLARALVPFAGDDGRRVWVEEFGQALPSPSSQPPLAPGPARATPSGAPTPPPPGRRSAPRLAADPRVYLRSVDALARLAPEDADALLSCVRWRGLAPGEVLFREGTPGVTMVFVAEGTLAVCSDAGGQRREFARVGVGHFVGEMACLDPAPRSATVLAATSAVVGELSREGLRTLQAVAPRASSVIVGAVIREVASRLREVEAHIDGALAPPATPPPGAPARGESTGVRRLFDWLRGER